MSSIPSKNVTGQVITGIILILFLSILPVAGGETITVGTAGDHPDIASALAASEDGDTIIIGPGTYQGPILVDHPVNIKAGVGVLVTATGSVLTVESNDVTISNLTLSSSGTASGVSTLALNGAGIEVSSLTITGGETGITIGPDGSGTILSDIEISETEWGIHGTQEADDLTMTDVDIDGGEDGVVIEGEGCILGWTTLTDIQGTAVKVFSSDNRLHNISITGGPSTGIALLDTKVVDADGNRLENISISGAAQGIAVDGASDTIMTWATIDSAGVGVEMTFASGTEMDRADIRGGDVGIRCARCSDSVIQASDIIDNVVGLQLRFMDQATIGTVRVSGNNLMENFLYAIELEMDVDDEGLEFMPGKNHYGSPAGPYPIGPGNGGSSGVNITDWSVEPYTTRPVADTIPPLLFVENFPEQGVAGAFLVNGTAFDSGGLVSIQISVDGGDSVDANGTERWTYLMSVDGLDVGEHTMTITAYDGVQWSIPFRGTFHVYDPDAGPLHLGSEESTPGPSVMLVFVSVAFGMILYRHRV